jgi:3D (Asp-Asp-Asp) domain-containing protein
MRYPKIGTVAVSRDLFQQGWVFGRQIYIEGHGVYTIQDLMNARWENRIDIVLGSSKAAIQFGKKLDVTVALLTI